MMAKLYSPISFWRAAVCACVALAAWAAHAADYPAPRRAGASRRLVPRPGRLGWAALEKPAVCRGCAESVL